MFGIHYNSHVQIDVVALIVVFEPLYDKRELLNTHYKHMKLRQLILHQ